MHYRFGVSINNSAVLFQDRNYERSRAFKFPIQIVRTPDNPMIAFICRNKRVLSLCFGFTVHAFQQNPRYSDCNIRAIYDSAMQNLLKIKSATRDLPF